MNHQKWPQTVKAWQQQSQSPKAAYAGETRRVNQSLNKGSPRSQGKRHQNIIRLLETQAQTLGLQSLHCVRKYYAFVFISEEKVLMEKVHIRCKLRQGSVSRVLGFYWLLGCKHKNAP